MDGELVEQPEPVYTAWPRDNLEFDCRFSASSTRRSPRPSARSTSISRARRSQARADTGLRPDDYATERLWATAPDGERVPISLVYRRDRPYGPGPLLLYGYGSYEASMDPTFRRYGCRCSTAASPMRSPTFAAEASASSLVRERQVPAQAEHVHVDFIACAEHLVAEAWTAPDRLVARGGSAGGLSWARS